jgi:hypothetical protein
MSPSVVVAGLLAVMLLHIGFGVPWRGVYAPAIIFTVIYAFFCVGMFWVRKQFYRSRDLRLGVCITGIYTLVTVLIGMWYAGELGIAGPATFAENSIPFSVYMLVCTAILFVLSSYWKTRSKPK